MPFGGRDRDGTHRIGVAGGRTGGLLRRGLAVAAVLVSVSASFPALAHEDPGVQIVAVSREIELHPDDAGLYLQRADLHRSRSEWPLAMADLQAANRLDPELAVVDLLTARTLLEADNPHAALAAVDRFLVREGNQAGGHLTRARILLRLGSRPEAVAEFTRGIDLARAGGRTAQPDDYLDRARALASEGPGHVDDAIRGLDDGTAALGGAITLRLLAIDLEMERGHRDAALERISAIEATANRKESWMARRADVLWDDGRRDEAATVYRAALAAIHALPERLRGSAATLELAARIRTRLAGAPADSPADSPAHSPAGSAAHAAQTSDTTTHNEPKSAGRSPDGETP